MALDPYRSAVIFPGQSSRDWGMRALVETWRPELLDTLASAVADDDPFAAADASLAAAQAVTVTGSLAYWHAHGRPSPRYLVGHSIGELSALAAAHTLDEHDAVRLAAFRGKAMEHACATSPGCGMVATSAPSFEVEPIAEECGVWVAVCSTPGQTVLAGRADGLERTRGALADAGIPYTDLAALGAFSSPLMESAVAPFRAALSKCEIRPPQAIVYSAATCRPLIDVRVELARNLAAPVRWWETLARLAMEGVETFFEVCVGGLLSPMPAGIVTERAPRAPESGAAVPREHEVGVAPRMPEGGGGGDSPAGDAIFAYFDEQNCLHVLV